MKKRMIIMLVGVGLLFGGIVGYKTFSNIMLNKFLASRENIATVSAMTAETAPWQSQQKYYGSLKPYQGVNVTTEITGLVEKIYFKSGAILKKGDLIVQLNAKSDTALLRSLEANTTLAKITLQRDTAQYAIQAISKATLDTDKANFKSLEAQTAQQAAIVNKKTIRAPFAGRLGIVDINEGQYLNAGDTIAPLQDLHSIYADFYVPQQHVTTMSVGQVVRLTIDTFPQRIFEGKITTINPVVDSNTRNVKVEATLANPKYELIPGMFATINVDTGKPQPYITLPQTAVSFNSYGDVIFTLQEKGKDKKGQPMLVATQRFVTTGETRGDQVTILKGIQQGDRVVTSGQLKIKNGSRVVINNSVVPTNNPAPKTTEE
jgi:membrane fusion protein (multidrug efflux system)